MADVKSAKAHRKPVFGPPATPEIFDAKWKQKFESLDQKYAGPGKMAKDLMEQEKILTILANRLHETVPHIHFCAREAKELGLQLPYTRQEVEKNPMIVFESAVGRLETQRYGVQDMLNGYQDKKNGQLFQGKWRWQDLSLPLRKKINSIFDVVETERNRGNWDINDRAGMAFVEFRRALIPG